MTADRARGTDLQSEHRARRRGWTSRAPTGNDSFLATLREYIREKPKTRTWHEVSMELGLRQGDEVARDSVADRWRDREIGEITNDDVFVILEECRTRGTPGRRVKGTGAARHRAMVKTLAAFFEWAVDRRKVASNVVRGFKVVPIPERERVLSDKELRAVWHALDAAPLPYASAFRAMIYTGQRRTEVGSMQWDEVDGSTWTIPAARMKGKRAHTVHLTARVLAVLDEVPRVEGCNFVFTVDGRKPIASWANAKRAVEERAAIAPWTLHDFRRTAITWWYENGVAPHVVEAIVAHRYHRSGVAGRYNFAGYAEARKQAMERWAAHVTALID
jgi:integrase